MGSTRANSQEVVEEEEEVPGVGLTGKEHLLEEPATCT